MSLLNELQAAIDKEEFNGFEWAGFKEKPELALLAGAVVGHNLALSRVLNVVKREVKNESGDTVQLQKG